MQDRRGCLLRICWILLLLKQGLGNTKSAAWGTAHNMTTGCITKDSHFTDESQLYMPKFVRLRKIPCGAHPSKFPLCLAAWILKSNSAQFQLAEVIARRHKTLLTNLEKKKKTDHSYVTSKITSHWIILQKVWEFGLQHKSEKGSIEED